MVIGPSEEKKNKNRFINIALEISSIEPFNMFKLKILDYQRYSPSKKKFLI
jgi:hypothetical protein